MRTVPTDIPEKINQFEKTANSLMFERSIEIRCCINALLSKRHVCMIGPPGIGKSFLTRTFVALIDGIEDGEYFEWFLGKFSTPEELFGPHSLRALENDQYIRNTRQKLPEAKLSFIDEIWNANTANLNTLLPIMNERLFYNNGQPSHVPLATLISASNSTPEESSELAALWDRIAFRLYVKPIQNEGNFEGMLRAASQRFAEGERVEPVISWQDLLEAQEAVKEVAITDDVFEALVNLRGTLYQEGIEPSERRFVESLPIIQAQAYRDGRKETDIEDMRILAHVLWNTQNQQPKVQKLVYELANPLDKVALEMMEDVEKLAKQIDEILKNSDNSTERSRKAVAVHSKLEEAAADLGKLRKQARQEGRKSEIMEPLRQRILQLTRTLLSEVFSIEEGLAPDLP